MSNSFKKKFEVVDRLLKSQQKNILDILCDNEFKIEKKNLFSNKYKNHFSENDIDFLAKELPNSSSCADFVDLLDKQKKKYDELYTSEEERKEYDPKKMIELFDKIREITNQFEWYYDIANNKLYFSLKDGKEIKTDLLTPEGVKKITEMMLQSQESNYINFINKIFQGLDKKNISQSPTSQQLNVEFKNLLDIILDNNGNSRYNFEFKKVNGLDRIVLDIKDNKNKSNKNNLILEIEEEKAPLTGYSIFIGSLDEQNIRRKDGILFNSNCFVSLIDNKKSKEELNFSELISLLKKDRNKFTFAEKSIANSLKSINKSLGLSK